MVTKIDVSEARPNTHPGGFGAALQQHSPFKSPNAIGKNSRANLKAFGLRAGLIGQDAQELFLSGGGRHIAGLKDWVG